MTPTTFRATLEDLGLTVQRYAALTGMNYTTCQFWGRERSGRGVQEFPRTVTLLLRAWTAHPDLIPDP